MASSAEASWSSSDDKTKLEHSIVLASYSPAEVVYRFASMPQPTPPTEPERADFDSAVGFVDVSGFTKLSEKLAKEHGRKGAELLNTYVNCAPQHAGRTPAASKQAGGRTDPGQSMKSRGHQPSLRQ